MTDNPSAAPQKPMNDADQPRTGGQPGAARKSQFMARLENQKAQLERHGNFAEVVIRTTPEGTDMINFARLWEYVLVQADRQTRGYVAKSSRADFEATRKDFEDCVDFMVQRLRASIGRHKLDMGGTNFISRVAQRYQVVEKVRKAPAAQTAPAAPAVQPQPQTAPAPRPVEDEVDAI